jgi:hypothetical protein
MRRLAILLLSCWKTPVKTSIEPVAGEKWILHVDKTDPWGGNKYPPVKILDVKEGWVRYKIGDYIFKDERMPVERFVAIYDYHST